MAKYNRVDREVEVHCANCGKVFTEYVYCDEEEKTYVPCPKCDYDCEEDYKEAIR